MNFNVTAYVHGGIVYTQVLMLSKATPLSAVYFQKVERYAEMHKKMRFGAILLSN